MDKIAVVTDDTILVTIPIIPMLGLTEPTTFGINKANFQLLCRVIVGVCTFFIFWPKIAPAFGLSSGRGAMSGQDKEAQIKEIQERIAKIEHERGEKTSQKSYAVATGPASDKESVTPAQPSGSKQKGNAKKRKA